MAEGLVRASDVQVARAQMDTASNDRKLGEILVANKAVSVLDLNTCLRLQARLWFVDLFGWRSGTIRLLPNESPPAWSARVNLDIHPMVMQALKQSGDQRVLNQLVEDLFQKKLSLPREMPSNLSDLADSPQQKSFLKNLDKGRTLAQAIRLSRRGRPRPMCTQATPGRRRRRPKRTRRRCRRRSRPPHGHAPGARGGLPDEVAGAPQGPAEKGDSGGGPPLSADDVAGLAMKFGAGEATPKADGGMRARGPLETPEIQPVVPIPFSLIVLEWDALDTSSDGSSAGLLGSQAKADMVHEVRSFGASLEEFSLSRLCAVVGIPKPVDDHRTQAAELALELVNVMRRAVDENSNARNIIVRGGIVGGIATPADSGATVGEAVAHGRRLVGLAEPWQVVAESPLYEDFQNLVLTRPVSCRPNLVEVRECLVRPQ